ncbi:quinone oxidoreductase [Rhodanobacter glycinis]|uniref:Quinone oxidoreductase n=1 Tax=Rhodanobacter glycinis TaxID=582702 RepID=A0A502CH24_9GAMM|nr:quinone oxidoreductase [Rhodanobacter glycinis]TPG11031.1 quinone oxidoreductase [Rhodanobacter glycinis]TPG48520.1 quinone oxidoreductase [Rhodanobacter glycinis]
MHALLFDKFGGPEVLRWGERPDPIPAPGQALLRMRSVGLNFADVYRRNGNYHLSGTAPWVLGYEGAGVIEQAAAGDQLFPVGTRVGFADMPQANAELVAVDIDKLIPLPDDITFDTAAATLLQGLTAQYLVTDSYKVRRGDVAVVHAAAGGVGQLLVQMLKVRGATVLGVASSASKRAAVLAAGADAACGYDDLPAQAKQLGAGRGADVVYDSIGRTLGDSLAAARIGGTVVFYGMAAGDPDPVDPRLLMDRSLTLTGGDLWNVLTSAAIRRERAAALFAQIRAGKLRPNIAARFALSDGGSAHAYLESRAAIGKVLLTL